MKLVGLHALALIIAACDGPTGPLALTAATPPFAPLLGGTRIVLSGHGFAAGPAHVLIDDRPAVLATAIDDTTLVVVVPPGDHAGDVEIVALVGSANVHATGLLHYSAPPTITSVTPRDVLYASGAMRVTVTGTAFLDEDAGDVQVAIDGQLASDVEVASDSQLSFVAPIGLPLARPTLALVNQRGRAVHDRAFRYTPGARGGLLLFSAFGPSFATFFDPVDLSLVAIPRVAPQQTRFTSVARDDVGDYDAMDRNGRYGRLDLSSQLVESPLQIGGLFPTMIRDRGTLYAIDRNSLRFGTFDPSTGFQAIGSDLLPCCGFGLAASASGTFYLTARGGNGVTLATIDRATGAMSTPIPITGGGPGFHVEEMRFFNGTLYATSRDGTLVVIDPDTAVATPLVTFPGAEQFKAMELFE